MLESRLHLDWELLEGNYWLHSPPNADPGLAWPRAGARGMFVNFNLDQFTANCVLPRLTFEHLKAWSSWAYLSQR